jgi:hypothetical protein
MRSSFISLKKLRYLSALAKCDLLVIYDSYSNFYENLNWLVVFAPLLYTGLFVPWIDIKVETHIELFLFDVRNGYMYTHIAMEDSIKKDYIIPINTDEVEKSLEKELINKMSNDVATEFKKVFKEYTNN